MSKKITGSLVKELSGLNMNKNMSGKKMSDNDEDDKVVNGSVSMPNMKGGKMGKLKNKRMGNRNKY